MPMQMAPQTQYTPTPNVNVPASTTNVLPYGDVGRSCSGGDKIYLSEIGGGERSAVLGFARFRMDSEPIYGKWAWLLMLGGVANLYGPVDGRHNPGQSEAQEYIHRIGTGDVSARVISRGFLLSCCLGCEQVGQRGS